MIAVGSATGLPPGRAVRCTGSLPRREDAGIGRHKPAAGCPASVCVGNPAALSAQKGGPMSCACGRCAAHNSWQRGEAHWWAHVRLHGARCTGGHRALRASDWPPVRLHPPRRAWRCTASGAGCRSSLLGRTTSCSSRGQVDCEPCRRLAGLHLAPALAVITPPSPRAMLHGRSGPGAATPATELRPSSARGAGVAARCATAAGS